MTPREEYNQTLANSLIPRMEKRNFEACYCATKEEACQKAISYLQEGSSIGWGGSMTMEEIGLMDYLKNNADKYVIYDRMTAKTPKEQKEMFAKIITADNFLMSANAITLDGELVNVDGNGNRVACLCNGPDNVIVIASLNKVVKDEKNAYDRARNVAAPLNAARLNTATPCHVNGFCSDCKSPSCMCCQLVTTRFSRVKGRIKVILVGEPCGY